MSDHGGGLLVWSVALLAGGGLGVVFFGGLWWTVRRAAQSRTLARWFLASLFLRTAVVLTGFYLVGAGQPEQIGLSLLGFLLARAAVLQVTKPAPDAAAPISGVPPCA